LIDVQRPLSPGQAGPIKLDIDTFDCGEGEEKAFIDHMYDPRYYDSGYKIILFYRRNDNELDAVENKILDASYITDAKNHAVWDVVSELLPDIPRFYPTVTGITLKEKSPPPSPKTWTKSSTISPSHLSHILTVPITELQKVSGLDMDVDRVKWKGDRHMSSRRPGKVSKELFANLLSLTGCPSHVISST
jgi:hypothetical protein